MFAACARCKCAPYIRAAARDRSDAGTQSIGIAHSRKLKHQSACLYMRDWAPPPDWA